MSDWRRSHGMTMLELLVVIAIIGVAASMTAVAWRGLVQREEARSALTSLRQAMWQGATAASARGEELTLRWQGDELVLVGTGGDAVRRWDFAADTPTTLAPGEILAFTPPGRVASLDGLPDPLTVVVDDRTATLEVSLIGETEVSW